MNNVNGVNGDLDGDDSGEETHELLIPAVTGFQESYVKKVVDTVNDLDNVLYEISSGSHRKSHAWQCHMIRFIKQYEATKSKRHPVGMSIEYPGGSNQRLVESPADWISPGAHGVDLMINKGKLVVDDTCYWTARALASIVPGPGRGSCWGHTHCSLTITTAMPTGNQAKRSFRRPIPDGRA